MKKNVYIIPHTHWDREWYFTTEESKILLVNNMEEILEMLENNDEYECYVLDGQTAILEDYFKVKPENKTRVKELVQKGKLIIGPWYTQTDEMVVGGESIVRNLLYGIKDCEEFGDYMKIGYLPDSFGQSAQIPQILNGFDIYRSIFWRGVSEHNGTDKTEFYWESDNGSKVLVQLLPLGYAIGKYLPTDEQKLKERLDKNFKILDKGATTDNIILPNGHDQMPIQKNIFEVIDILKKLYPERNFFLSRYENVFNEIEKKQGLDTLRGEFLDGKYMRVHRSIYSTRMDIKAANTRIENKITNILEPLSSLAYYLGFTYHSGIMEQIWKEIMKNHAHDSMGCCCSDKVHREIMSRYAIAEEQTDQLIRFNMRKIVDAMPCDKSLDKLVLFNMLPYSREEAVQTEITTKMKNFQLWDVDGNELTFEVVDKEIVDPGLIDRQIVHYGNYDPFIRYTIQFKDVFPAMGYKTYFIKESNTVKEQNITTVSNINTEFYSISVNENGSLNIFDKKLNKRFDNVLIIEDGADDGDEYDYSPLLDDFIILSDKVKANYTMKQNRYFSVIDVNYKLQVPNDIESRKKKLCDGSMDIKMRLTIPVNKPLIDVKIEINNRVNDHRVRALIPTGLKSKFSISDNQFGTIKRAVVDPSMEIWQKENWEERPDSIYPMLSYVGLSDENFGVAVLTDSTREYEIVGEDYDTIAVTLFRSMGYLGKEELLRRPGRPSGIKLATPDSQMIGPVKLHFAITTHENSTQKANVAALAKEFLTPIYAYNKIPYDAMKLNSVDFNVNYSFSLFEEKNRDTVLSTVKKSEKGEGIIIRFFNPSNDEKTVLIKSNYLLKYAKITNLNEKPIEDIKITDGREISVTTKKNEVKTILLK